MQSQRHALRDNTHKRSIFCWGNGAVTLHKRACVMARPLNRLFNPASLAVVGGGAWCEAAITQAQSFGFRGNIWPVHPKKDKVAGLPTFANVDDLPQAPDASFIGVNRDATIDVVRQLAAQDAGGCVCFASGFAEAMAEDAIAGDAQHRLTKAAGEMPILGPNCYGFINALDQALVWPDQHGLTPVERGVAILTQSSNIAINLSFQARAVPIAMMVTCGNMAQISQAAIVDALLDDPRITAIGLHIEGFVDLPGWARVAQKAHAKDVPLIALKAGRSEQARAATQSHTASLAGQDAGAQALLQALGIGRVDRLETFLEALKLGHVCGRLNAATAVSISCSGGEASLAADLGHSAGVTFPPLSPEQEKKLRQALGPKVALANPLDYHTYIWRNTQAMTDAWAAIMTPDIGLCLTIVDIPDPARADPSDWQCAIDAAIGAKQRTGADVAFVSSLPETLPADTATHLLAQGVVPMQGLADAMAAIPALVRHAPQDRLVASAIHATNMTHDELATKTVMTHFDVPMPNRIIWTNDRHALTGLTYPVAVKGSGFVHKTENNAILLHLADAAQAETALTQVNSIGPKFVEEMIPGGLVELLVGFTNDGVHGIMLTLGAGGTLTELMQDTAHLALPVTAATIETALASLRIAPLIDGYRGKPAASRAAIVQTVLRLQDMVIAHCDGFVELEVNPLICTADAAYVADAYWQQSEPETT